MTKLEALRSYTDAQKRDSWITLGQAEIDSNSKYFMKNALFRLVAAGVPLNGALIFVSEECSPTLNWAGLNLGADGESIVDANMISVPYMHVILTNPAFNAITADYDPTFIPFQDSDALVIIDDLDLENILFEVGVPFIALEELEYTREQLLRNAIWPAMKEYFKWFPIIEMETRPMGAGGRFEIDIPTYAYTAQRVYLVPGFGVDVYSRNPFYMSWAQGNSGFGYPGSPVIGAPGTNRNMRRRYTDIRGFETYILERAARQGAVNYGKRTRIRINIANKKIIGFVNQIGTLEIEWAVNSHDWSDIPFQRQSEVRDLAKAYVMRGLAMLRQQSPKDIPGVLDVSQFLTRATELEKATLEVWRSATKAVVVRS